MADACDIENLDLLSDADRAAANSIYYTVLVNTKSVSEGRAKVNLFKGYYVLVITSLVAAVDLERLMDEFTPFTNDINNMWIEYSNSSLCISLLFRGKKSPEDLPNIVVSDISKYYEEYLLVDDKCDKSLKDLDDNERSIIGGLVRSIAMKGVVSVKNVDDFKVSVVRDLRRYTINLEDYSDRLDLYRLSELIRSYIGNFSNTVKSKKTHLPIGQCNASIEVDVDSAYFDKGKKRANNDQTDDGAATKRNRPE
jgi:hypothetical protein